MLSLLLNPGFCDGLNACFDDDPGTGLLSTLSLLPKSGFQDGPNTGLQDGLDPGFGDDRQVERLPLGSAVCGQSIADLVDEAEVEPSVLLTVLLDGLAAVCDDPKRLPLARPMLVSDVLASCPESRVTLVLVPPKRPAPLIVLWLRRQTLVAVPMLLPTPDLLKTLVPVLVSCPNSLMVPKIESFWEPKASLD